MMIRTLETEDAASVAVTLENRLRERLEAAGLEIETLLFDCYTDILDTLVGSLAGNQFIAPYDEVVREGAEQGRMALRCLEAAG